MTKRTNLAAEIRRTFVLQKTVSKVFHAPCRHQPSGGALSLTRTFILTLFLVTIASGIATVSKNVAAASTVETKSLDTRFAGVVYRDQIEASGAADLFDFLLSRGDYNTFGLFRPNVSTSTYLINGKLIPSPYKSYVLEFLPIAAVEKIEFLGAGAASLYAGGAIGGAFNIVLRKNFEGTEAWTNFQSPVELGGETEVGGGMWGGKAGQGHLILGAEVFKRNEIRGIDRDYSHPRWTENGDFADVTGVSVAGNTLFILENNRYTAYPLGDCSTASGYSGTLNNPAGLAGSGCGYVYGNHIWEWESLDRESFFTSYEQPLGENSEFFLDVRLAQGETEFEYAPPVGFFVFTPTGDFAQSLIDALPEVSEIESHVIAYHRFVAHGNRNWVWDLAESDLLLGIRGALNSGVDYELSARSYVSDGTERSRTFVSDELAESAIEQGRYNLANPFSTDPIHLDAVEEMSITKTQNYLIDRKALHALFNGSTSSSSFGEVDWASGIEIERYQEHEIHTHEHAEGIDHPTGEALGSETRNYAGERSRLSGFVNLRIPLRENLELTPAVRFDRHNDVGTTLGWQLASAMQLDESLQVRGSLEAGRQPPSIQQLYLGESRRFPFICDPLTTADPAANCDRFQVLTVDSGNPLLEPDRSKALNLGATLDQGDVSVSVDLYRIERKEVPVVPDAQLLVDLAAEGVELPTGAAVIRQEEGNHVIQIDRPLLNYGEVVRSGVNIGFETGWTTEMCETDLGVYWHYTDKIEVKIGGIEEPAYFPRNRVNAVLSTRWDNLTTTWNVYGISSHSHGFGNYKRWIGHDFMLNFRGDFGGIEGLELSAGVINIGNRGPSVDSKDPSLAETRFDAVRGRTFVFSVRSEW